MAPYVRGPDLPLRTPPGRSWAVAAIALLAAFLVVAQARTERQMRRLLGVRAPQLAELAYRMQRADRQRAQLETRIVELRQQLAAASQTAAQSERGLRTLGTQLQAYRLQAGLTLVEGPGVIIEMSDNPNPLRSGANPNEGLLHYTDLVRVVGDLWANGAEAIAVNDERLTGTSGIECVGTTILINQRRLTPPFRILAIGDPAALSSGAGRPGAGLDQLRAFGFPVRITRAARLALPAYRGAIASTTMR